MRGGNYYISVLPINIQILVTENVAFNCQVKLF